MAPQRMRGLARMALFRIRPRIAAALFTLISWVPMAPQTTTELVAILKSSRETLREAMAGITEENACKCPEPGRWTAIECVEHLTIAEESMLRRLKNGEVLAEPIYLPEREARMTTVVAGRATAVQAPPAALPTGRFASAAEAIEGFTTARERTIEFVETAPNLRALQVTHPFFGAISGYELAMITASHSLRHAIQIREIRESIESHG